MALSRLELIDLHDHLLEIQHIIRNDDVGITWELEEENDRLIEAVLREMSNAS